MSSLPPDSIIVANDLTPSMTAKIKIENVLGFLTQKGGRTSHATILARALGIPAVLSVKGILSDIKDGDTVIIDGEKGEAFLNPDEEKIRRYLKKRERFLRAKEKLIKYKDRKTVTGDGKDILLFSNIGVPKETEKVKQFGAALSGVGTVIIRTLDMGGDKEVSNLGAETEQNPFLGYRAVRLCLDRQDLFNAQLRAILRASAYGDIKMMIPLVTCIDELLIVKCMVKNIMAQLDSEGEKYNKNIEIGVMIETPAATEIADILAKEADFFSIGTNDLTQYTMAADRGNARVEYLCSAYNIAVLRSIKRIVECAEREEIMCSMCGEAASDINLIPLWLSFGLKELSVSPSSILQTRKTISLWTIPECNSLAERAMSLTKENEIRKLLKENARD